MPFSTQTVATLDNLETLLQGIRLVVADIDYTLVDFGSAHVAGMKALAHTLGQPIADRVGEYFNLTLEGLRKTVGEEWAERVDFDQLMADVVVAQKDFLTEDGPRLWSRETWIYIADKTLTNEQVLAGRDSYWQAVTDASIFYVDTPLFLDYMKAHAIPLILMTGSDSILKINDDLTFDYDPEYSEQYKRKRLSHLHFGAQEIVIGDPIDKPDQAFFSRVLEVASQIDQFPHNQVLFMGDSLRNDLEVPQDLGYQTLLVKRI